MKYMILKNGISSSYDANCIEIHNNSVESIVFEILKYTGWKETDFLFHIKHEEKSNFIDFFNSWDWIIHYYYYY